MSELLAGRADALGVGLLLGLAATLACLAVGWWRNRRHPGAPVPVAGLALAAAGAAGVALATDPPATMALPAPALLAAAAVAGLPLAGFDRRRWRQGVTLPLLAISAVGVWATVPDVEAALVVVGVTLPMAVLGWPSPLHRTRPPPSLGMAGALGVAGLFVWTVAAGSSGRPAAAAGGLACLGVLVVEPVARLLAPRRGGRPRPPGDHPPGPPARPGRVLAAQLVLVVLAARVVGRVERPALAWTLALALLAAAVAVAAVAARRPSSADRTAA